MNSRSRDPGLLMAAILLVIGLSAALSVDAVRDTYGVKGDESTYIAMALSLPHDGNLSYERADLERFWRFYQYGPEGVFLKRGKRLRVGLQDDWPFLNLRQLPDNRPERLYYGKAFLHALLAAPLVWIWDINGLLVLNVLLLTGVFLAAYRFLAASSPPGASALFALAFFGVTIAPIYLVWLTPEILNFSLVFFAYFCWLYKEVSPTEADHTTWLRGPASDRIAAVLLGLATYSKPPNLGLALPLVALFLWRRRWNRAVRTGLLVLAVAGGSFFVNALVTGEFNYQGGDRKTFYGDFPFTAPGATFDNRGIDMTTNALATEDVFDPGGYLSVFVHNLEYFAVGRHFGFMPYFFPGLVVIALFLRHWLDRPSWQYFTLGAVAATAIGLLILIPNAWSGGGGPPGNRYFLSAYPALLFVTPRLRSMRPALVAWAGGAVFMAPILMNPFIGARDTWRNAERGLFRLLPVELTMVNDLPVMLNSPRAHVPYGPNDELLLYFLDQNAFLPERAGIWIAGQARAEIIVRTGAPITHLALTLESPHANSVDVRAGAERHRMELKPGVPAEIVIEPRGVYSRRSYAYLLSVTARDGFVPRLDNPNSNDGRHLGVLIKSLRAEMDAPPSDTLRR